MIKFSVCLNRHVFVMVYRKDLKIFARCLLLCFLIPTMRVCRLISVQAVCVICSDNVFSLDVGHFTYCRTAYITVSQRVKHNVYTKLMRCCIYVICPLGYMLVVLIKALISVLLWRSVGRGRSEKLCSFSLIYHGRMDRLICRL